MRVILSCTLAALVCAGLFAEDKKADAIDAKKLIGKWEPKERKEGEPTVIEFAAGSKVTITHSMKGKEFTNEAKYKLDGDRLSLALKIADKEIEVTATVLKLTDTELTTKNDKGEERTLVRVKDKK